MENLWNGAGVCLENILRLKGMWSFLGERRLNKDYLRFYPNGWFSVLSPAANVLSVYDGETEKISAVKNFHVFENGYMAFSNNDDTFSYGSPDENGMRSIVRNVKFFCRYAAVIYEEKGNLFACRPDKYGQMADIYLGPAEDITEVLDNPNGMIIVRRPWVAEVFDRNGKKIHPARDIIDATFLQNGLLWMAAKTGSCIFDETLNKIANGAIAKGDYGCFYEINGTLYDCRDGKAASEQPIVFNDGTKVLFRDNCLIHADGRLLLNYCPEEPVPVCKHLLYIRYNGMDLAFDESIGKQQMLTLVSGLLRETPQDISQPMFEYLQTIVEFLNGGIKRKDMLLHLIGTVS